MYLSTLTAVCVGGSYIYDGAGGVSSWKGWFSVKGEWGGVRAWGISFCEFWRIGEAFRMNEFVYIYIYVYGSRWGDGFDWFMSFCRFRYYFKCLSRKSLINWTCRMCLTFIMAFLLWATWRHTCPILWRWHFDLHRFNDINVVIWGYILRKLLYIG